MSDVANLLNAVNGLFIAVWQFAAVFCSSLYHLVTNVANLIFTVTIATFSFIIEAVSNVPQFVFRFWALVQPAFVYFFSQACILLPYSWNFMGKLITWAWFQMCALAANLGVGIAQIWSWTIQAASFIASSVSSTTVWVVSSIVSVTSHVPGLIQGFLENIKVGVIFITGRFSVALSYIRSISLSTFEIIGVLWGYLWSFVLALALSAWNVLAIVCASGIDLISGIFNFLLTFLSNVPQFVFRFWALVQPAFVYFFSQACILLSYSWNFMGKLITWAWFHMCALAANLGVGIAQYRSWTIQAASFIASSVSSTTVWVVSSIVSVTSHVPGLIQVFLENIKVGVIFITGRFSVALSYIRSISLSTFEIIGVLWGYLWSFVLALALSAWNVLAIVCASGIDLISGIFNFLLTFLSNVPQFVFRFWALVQPAFVYFFSQACILLPYSWNFMKKLITWAWFHMCALAANLE